MESDLSTKDVRYLFCTRCGIPVWGWGRHREKVCRPTGKHPFFFWGSRSGGARGSRLRPLAQRGFTLTELMVVIFIIGLLTTLVLINVLPSQDRAMAIKARADITLLEQALEIYRLENFSYPSTVEGLSALLAPPARGSAGVSVGRQAGVAYRRGGYIKRLPSDPWGQPYVYQAPAPDGAPYALLSYGADGAPGGSEENSDIRNSS